MPKMKTHRGAAKRFKRTASGKISRMKKGKQHILTKKRMKRKRQLRSKNELTGEDARRIKELLVKN